MSVNKISFLLFFMLVINSLTINAQNIENIDKSVQKVVGEYTNSEKIKDSTAIYSYAITINVFQKKGIQIVNPTLNNPKALLFFEGLEKLKEINYLPLMGKRKNMTFFFCTYILVYGSKQDINTIKLNDLSKSIKYLLLSDKKEMYNLGALVIEIDKKIYN